MGSAVGIPFRGSPPLPPQSVLSWPSSADPDLEFESRPQFQFLVSRSMVCWSLDFDVPVSTSTTGGLPRFPLPLRPPNHTGVQDLLLTQKQRRSLAENSPGAGALAVLFPATSLWVSGACWLTAPLKYLLNEWRSLIRQSHSTSYSQHKLMFCPVFSPGPSSDLLTKFYVQPCTHKSCYKLPAPPHLPLLSRRHIHCLMSQLFDLS